MLYWEAVLHRAFVGQGPRPPRPAKAFGFWYWRTGACYYWHGVGGFMFNSSVASVVVAVVVVVVVVVVWWSWWMWWYGG